MHNKVNPYPSGYAQVQDRRMPGKDFKQGNKQTLHMNKMKTIFYILLSSSLFIISCNTNNHNEKPNIIFFLADDCTNWDIASYGRVDSKTPNIDKLAQQGVKFNRCYQAAPMCSPTRHNLITGVYPVKTGAYPNHTFAKEGTKKFGALFNAIRLPGGTSWKETH